MNAPKKIWVWGYAADQMVNDNPDSTDIPYIRADLVDGLVKAVETAREVFQVYQAHHEYKGDEKKAERNKFYAEQMEAALKALESAEIGRGME
jgi:hypothetical protein